MAKATVNGFELFYETSGDGEIPLVVVHGSWSSHHNWNRVVSGLAKSFRVLSYDRREHSESQRRASQGSIREDVADLAGAYSARGAEAYVETITAFIQRSVT